MKKIFLNPLVIFLISLITGALYLSLSNTYQKMRSSTENLSILDQEIEKLSSEVFNLEKKLEEANSTSYQEKIIRDELLMKRPGEYIIQLTNQPKKDDPLIISSETNPSQEWHQLLFN